MFLLLRLHNIIIRYLNEQFMLHIVNISTIKLILKKVLFLILTSTALIKCSEQRDASTKNPIATISYNHLPYDIHQLMYSNYLYNEYDLSINLKRAALCLGLTCKEQYELCKKFAIPLIEERFLDFLFKDDQTQYYDPYFHILIQPNFFYILLQEIELAEEQLRIRENLHCKLSLLVDKKQKIDTLSGEIDLAKDEKESLENGIMHILKTNPPCKKDHSGLAVPKQQASTELNQLSKTRQMEKTSKLRTLNNNIEQSKKENTEKEKTADRCEECYRDEGVQKNLDVLYRNFYNKINELITLIQSFRREEDNKKRLSKEAKELDNALTMDQYKDIYIIKRYSNNNPFNFKDSYKWCQTYKEQLKKMRTYIFICLIKRYLCNFLYTEDYYNTSGDVIFTEYIEPHIPTYIRTPNRKDNDSSTKLNHTNNIQKKINIDFKKFTSKLIDNNKKGKSNFPYYNLFLKKYASEYDVSQIIMDSINGYGTNELKSIKQKTILTFYGQCDLKPSLYKIFIDLQKKANDHNHTYTVTIRSTTEPLSDHFKKYNEHFLYAIYFNWFSPFITFRLETPINQHFTLNELNKTQQQQVHKSIFRFFAEKISLYKYKKRDPHQKKLVEISILKYFYYLLLHINFTMNSEDNSIDNTAIAKTAAKIFRVKPSCFNLAHYALLFVVFLGYVAVITKDASSFFSDENLISHRITILLSILTVSRRTDKNDKDKHENDFNVKAPWHVGYALLRDMLLIYSIYKYRTVPYTLALHSILELCIVGKSLFWVPLVKHLWDYNALSEVVFY